MKNILQQKSTDEQHGRTKYILEYVDKADVKDKKMLNIGCGFGWFEYHMSRRGCKHIYGTEINEKDLETALKGEHDEKVSFGLGNAIDLPFEDETFDTVVAWDVIEHIPPNTEKKMLSEIERVLKNGGVFYLSTPYRSFWGTCLDPAWWLIKHRHYSKEIMGNIIKNNKKLEITEMQIRGGRSDILSILNMYIAKWVFRRKPFFEEFFNNKSDDEYQSKKEGTSTLFVKGKKV